MLSNGEKSIIEIRNKIKQNKLVIFVGAGVSRNSGFPDWEMLTQEYFQMYDVKNDYKDSDINVLEVYENALHLDEDLFFNKIGDIFGKNSNDKIKDNSIVDLIISLNPQHIITTNYDYLIEHGLKKKYANYNKVVKDSDLINRTSYNQFIKVHGDFEHKDQIVMSESQYLGFSETHPLIENFIKSLLVDHSFLFIGYSYKDINLRIIMNWIKQRVKDKSDGPKHFFISPDNSELGKHMGLYLKTMNTELLEYLDYSDEIEKIVLSVPNDISSSIGINLFRFLSYISSQYITYEGLKHILNEFEIINHMFPLDLLEYLGIELYCTVVSDTLYFNKYMGDKINWIIDLFETLAKDISKNYKSSKTIRLINRIFVNSGISRFAFPLEQGYKFQLLVPEIIEHSDVNINYKLFDFISLNRIRTQLSEIKKHNFYSITTLVYLNKLFNYDNQIYLDTLKELRTVLFGNNEMKKVFVLSMCVDSIEFIRFRDSVRTYQIFDKLPHNEIIGSKALFSIISNNDFHKIDIITAFEKSLFSRHTTYMMNTHPLLIAHNKIKNYVKTYQENFIASDFNNSTLIDMVRIYFSTLMTNIRIYEEYKKEKEESNQVFDLTYKEEPQISLSDIWLVSKYLSRNHLYSILSMNNIKEIKLVDSEELIRRLNNLLRSLLTYGKNTNIRSQFESYTFLILYMRSHLENIEFDIDLIIKIYEKELELNLIDANDIIRLVHNMVFSTTKRYNAYYLLMLLNKKLLLEKTFDHRFLGTIEMVSNSIFDYLENKDIYPKEEYFETVTNIIERLGKTRSETVLSILLLQINTVPETLRAKISDILIQYNDVMFTKNSMMNLQLLLMHKLLDKKTVLPKIKEIYTESHRIVNSDRKTITLPDIHAENIDRVDTMIRNNLINDFR